MNRRTDSIKQLIQIRNELIDVGKGEEADADCSQDDLQLMKSAIAKLDYAIWKLSGIEADSNENISAELSEIINDLKSISAVEGEEDL